MTGGTDLTNTDPQLDPKGLQTSGGPTETVAPAIGSPAIDTIPTSSGSCPATDQRGNAVPDENESYCDIGAYETAYLRVSITGTPPSATTSRSASFTFSGSGGTGNLSFTCTLDAETATTCASPQSYSNLPSGSHTFTVMATDQAGHSGTASYHWTVDSVPPVISISSPTPSATYPLDQTGKSFNFSCTDTYDTVTQCDGSLTGTGISGSAMIKNGDPMPTSSAGSFTLTVATTDQVGNTNQQQVSYTVTNPFPVFSRLAPASVTAGSASLTLKLHGANFVYNVSQVDWNGSALTGATYFSNGTQVTSTGGLADEIDITVPSSALTGTGAVTITVVTSGPGGGTTSPQVFFVTPANVGVSAANSATSTSAGGTAIATVGGSGAGTSGSLTVYGSGQGTAAAAQYTTNPGTHCPPGCRQSLLRRLRASQ